MANRHDDFIEDVIEQGVQASFEFGIFWVKLAIIGAGLGIVGILVGIAAAFGAF